MSFYICIDIGGTAIKYGLAGEDGVLAERGSIRLWHGSGSNSQSLAMTQA